MGFNHPITNNKTEIMQHYVDFVVSEFSKLTKVQFNLTCTKTDQTNNSMKRKQMDNAEEHARNLDLLTQNRAKRQPPAFLR